MSQSTTFSSVILNAAERSGVIFQVETAAARATLVEMMADVDDEVGELFLMEEEVSTIAWPERSPT